MAASLMELFIKIGCDTKDVDKEFKNTEKKASGFGDTLKAILASQAIQKTFSFIIDGVKKIGSAFVGLVKSSVEAYAEYEQLVGGVETLFGAGGKSVEEYAQSVGKSVDEARADYDRLIASQNEVLNNARNAFKTAGIDANSYMTLATSFSGALLRSLNNDTQKAADLTQTAIVDMSDQANKYGTTVEQVSETYTSLARGNFQTLDNLFGGMFAGTKTGLNDMLRYAESYRASIGDTVEYSADSYADIVSAIHDVSEAMGVSGTTAEEAEKTISGSIGRTKAAWQNLIIGLGDSNADIGQLVNDVVSSAETAFWNLLPVIENVLNSIGEFVIKIAPIIEEKVPPLIDKLIPTIESMLTSLINIAVVVITQLAPVIIDAVSQVVQALFAEIENRYPVVAFILKWFNPASIAAAGGTAMMPLYEIFQLVYAFIKKTVEAIPQIISTVFNGIKDTIQTITTGIQTFITRTWELIKQYIVNPVQTAYDTVKTVFQNIYSSVSGKVQDTYNFISNVFGKVKDAIAKPFQTAYDTVKRIVDSIKNLFNFSWSLPRPKLPHVNWHWNDIGGILKLPVFDGISWYAKAYDRPYLLKAETVMGSAGFGDRGAYNGGEMVYGRDNLMNDIREASGANGWQSVLSVLNTYLPMILDACGQDIVLDDGTFIGRVLPKIDAGLSKRQDMMARTAL